MENCAQSVLKRLLRTFMFNTGVNSFTLPRHDHSVSSGICCTSITLQPRSGPSEGVCCSFVTRNSMFGLRSSSPSMLPNQEKGWTVHATSPMRNAEMIRKKGKVVAKKLRTIFGVLNLHDEYDTTHACKAVTGYARFDRSAREATPVNLCRHFVISQRWAVISWVVGIDASIDNSAYIWQ